MSEIRLHPRLRADDRAALDRVHDLRGLSQWRARASGRHARLAGLEVALDLHPGLRSAFLSALPRLGLLVDRLQAEHPDGVPLLLPERSAQVELSRAAMAGLGAHLLLGTLPPADDLHPEQPYNTLDRVLGDSLPSTVAKLCAWLQWLAQAVDQPPAGRLALERRCVPPPSADAWAACQRPLPPVRLVEDRGIELAHGCTQVDFANRFPGGGVLGRGNVQEELRFAMSPELLASTLLCPAMGPDEAILVHGAGHLARIEGYGGSARYAGPTSSPGPVGLDGTPQVEVLVLDAVAFLDGGDLARQLGLEFRLREAGKAWVGFAPSRWLGPAPIATGNWGCGVFGGHLPLKACLQWLAAGWHGRELHYHPFGDPRLGDLQGFVAAARAESWTVGRLWRAMDQVARQVEASRARPQGQGCALPDGRSFYEAVFSEAVRDADGRPRR